MPALLIIHKVKDFDTWYEGFLAHEEARRKHGGGDHQVFRSAEDSQEVVLLVEWDSIANAAAFTETSDLHQTMQNLGVLGQPQVLYLNEADQE